MRAVNVSRGTILAEECELARSFLARGRGLMGRPGLAAGAGMLIQPCSSVHTFFMRFPIDVIFLDRQRVVVGLQAAMPPNRPYAGAWRAHATLELPAGVIAATGTRIGDQIQIAE